MWKCVTQSFHIRPVRSGPVDPRLDSLRVKLFLAIAGGTAALALAAYLVFSWSFDRGFVDYVNQADEARVQKAYADFKNIETALKLYRLDNYVYPTTEQGLAALVEPSTLDPVPRNFRQGGYLEEVPIDPWGQPYLYVSPGEHREIDIFSLGADALTGGEGQNALRARCSMVPLSLPTEYSITGRSDSATASRMMWMLSASNRWRWLSTRGESRPASSSSPLGRPAEWLVVRQNTFGDPSRLVR